MCYVLFEASRSYLAFEIEDSRNLFFNIPEWYSELIIPVGFALLMIHFLVRVALTSRDVIRGTAS